jgi:hypothetical protein
MTVIPAEGSAREPGSIARKMGSGSPSARPGRQRRYCVLALTGAWRIACAGIAVATK